MSELKAAGKSFAISKQEVWEACVHGHEKVPVCGQVQVLAGGQVKVPIPRSSCRPGV